ncbi:MAG: hypothetical protein ACM3JH_01355 [Acidithiobacillales bacterium]
MRRRGLAALAALFALADAERSARLGGSISWMGRASAKHYQSIHSGRWRER